MLPLNLTIGEAPLKQNASGPFQVQWSPADLISEPHDISGGTVCSDFTHRAEAVVPLWSLYRLQLFDSPLPHSTHNFNKRNKPLFFWSCKSLPSFTFEGVFPNFKDTLIFFIFYLEFQKMLCSCEQLSKPKALHIFTTVMSSYNMSFSIVPSQ